MTITLDSLYTAKELLEREKGYSNPLSFSGIPIHTSEFLKPAKPKLELAKHISVSPECRSSFNKFLLDMFGESQPDIYMFSSRITMHPDTMARICFDSGI